MEKILVSLDLRHEYRPLLEQASKLALSFSANVLLVTVSEGDDSVATKLQAVAAEMAQLGVDAAAEILQGKPGDAVVAQANAENVDLLIIGSHGNSSVFDTLAGSAGQDIIQHAKRPILLVPVPKD